MHQKHHGLPHFGTGGFRLYFVSLLSVPIGILGGLAAWLLFKLIGLFSNLVFYHKYSFTLPMDLADQKLGPWLLLIPAAGGLIVGLMSKYGTSKIRGHGIPEAMEAVLINKSKIQPRVALLKPLSVAVSIGTGGPFGAEGPIIQTGGALGSLFGQLIEVSGGERKVLLASGAAAGMAATFSTPISAVIFAIELLLFEFSPRSFIPLAISSTIAMTVHDTLVGSGPLFHVLPMDFGVPFSLPFYALLGVLCGLGAVGFSRLFYWVEEQFERLPLDPLWWPAIGGLGLGVIGLIDPRVLGVGYSTITSILNDQLVLLSLISILVWKSLALLISLGSGTSGGLLAPMFTMGAAIGGIFAMLLNLAFPNLGLSPAAFAMVGMAALFAAASRATFAFIIFAFELTRNYDSILPLMLSCVIATAVALRLSSHSIMTERLARRGLRVDQNYEVDPFRQTKVKDAMVAVPHALQETTTVAEIASRIASHDLPLSLQQSFPLLDEAGKLSGMLSKGDMLLALEEGNAGMSVIEVGSRHPIVTFEDETLHDALGRMLAHDVASLPVVERGDVGKMVGFLTRASMLESRLGRFQEEHVREKGLFGKFPGKAA
jgi:H+/Cl- antiporter ClcA/predicted transcriptional regulator